MHRLIDMDNNEKHSQSVCEIHEDLFDDDKSQTEEIPLSGSRFHSLSLHHDMGAIYETFGYVLEK